MEEIMREFFIFIMTMCILALFGITFVAMSVIDYITPLIIIVLIRTWRRIFYGLSFAGFIIGGLLMLLGKDNNLRGWGIISFVIGLTFFTNAFFHSERRHEGTSVHS